MRQNEILMKKINEDAQSDQETKAQNEYLRKQLGAFLKQKEKVNNEPLQFEPRRQENVFSHIVYSSSEDEPLRMARPEPRFQADTNDFNVEIPEFEGKLDPEEFLNWLHTFERVLSTKMLLKTRKSS